MSPVPAVQDLIADHAKEEKDPDTAAALAAMAESPFLWPDDAMLSQLKFGREFTTDEETRGVGLRSSSPSRRASGSTMSGGSTRRAG